MMENATVFRTPSGDEMVVIERRRYDELVASEQMMDDVSTYDRVKARIESGQDELVPAAVAAALLDGENPVRAWRQHRGLAQSELAGLAGLAVSYLSNIETGARQGTVDKLARIAAALGITLDDLV